MIEPSLKQLPPLLIDDDAEEFVANSDLSEYDLSGFKKARFIFEEEGGKPESTAAKELTYSFSNG